MGKSALKLSILSAAQRQIDLLEEDGQSAVSFRRFFAAFLAGENYNVEMLAYLVDFIIEQEEASF